jgi:hypothetical protein
VRGAEPAADQPSHFVDGLGGEAEALDLQALQVFRQSYLKPQDLQRQVGVFEEPLAPLRLLGGDQGC